MADEKNDMSPDLMAALDQFAPFVDVVTGMVQQLKDRGFTDDQAHMLVTLCLIESSQR